MSGRKETVDSGMGAFSDALQTIFKGKGGVRDSDLRVWENWD